MKNLLKRFTSVMIVLCMIALNLPVFATDYDGTKDARGNTGVVFLGTGDTPAVDAQPLTDAWGWTAKDTAGGTDGTKFWLGIYVENLDKINKDMNHFYYDDDSDYGGIFSTAVALEYDTRYIRPLVLDMNNKNKNNAVKNAVFMTGSKWDTAGMLSKYKVASAEPQALVTEETSEEHEVDVNNASSYYVSFAATNFQEDDAALYNSPTKGIDGDRVYLLALQFELIEKPTTGTKVVGLARNPQQFVIETGNNGSIWKGTWNSQDDSSARDGNLQYHLNYDGAVDLFPTTYSIEFYNSYDPGTKTYGTKLTGKDITGIKEGDTVAKTTDAKMPADSDFTNDDTTKYLSKPLKYIGADGKAHDFDPNTTVLNSTLFASDATDKTTLKVFAEWADGHTVTFHSKYPDNTDTTVTRTVSPNSPSAIKKTEEPTVGTADTDFIVPDGYAFDGWYTQENGGGDKIVFAEDGVDGTDVCSEINPITDVYAKWQPMYTVKFYKQEGDSNEIKTALQFDPSADESNRTITSSDLPTEGDRGTIDGKRFDGWYYKVGSSGTGTKFEDSTSLVVNDNVVIYGKWVDVVTVSFYDSKTDPVAASSWEVDKGKTVADLTASQTIPTKTDNDSTHKYFIGWKNKTNDSAVDFTDSTYTFNADLDVYADYGKYYEIKYYDDAKDGSPSQFGSTVYVNPNSSNKNPVITTSDIPSTPPTSTDPDKGFSKWVYYVSGNKKDFGAGVSVTGNIDVYPEWADLISINFDYNGGTLDSASDKTLKIKPSTSISSANNGSLLAPVPTRTYGGHSYILKGWAASANSQTPDYTTNTINSTVFAAGTKLYAVWAVDPNSDPNNLATLTFDSVGGSPVSPITVYKGDTITAAQMPADPTKTSATNKPYTFDGWYEEATLTNTNKFTTPITLNADDTAYAHWKYEQSDAITISFNDDGATTAVSPKSIQIAPGDSIGDAWPTDPAKTDNTFGGWYTDTSDESTKKDKNSTFAQSTILNAKWVADITVNYDANGGSNAPTSVTKPAGDTYADPDVTGMSNGTYTFVGWNTKKNGSGTYVPASGASLTYQDVADLYKPDGGTAPASVTLYAQWAAVPNTPDDTGKVKTSTPTNPDPTQQGVRVTFADNAPSGITASANPQYKYPQYGDTIGAENMPEVPTRTNYKYVSWNTKPDGSGVTVDGTIAIGANLGDAIKAIENTTTAYEVTLYAQWEVDPDYKGDTVTLTFNKNTDGKGADDNPITKTIVKDDSLGYLPTDPTNDDFSFDGWFTGSANANGKIEFTGNKLTSSTPISADTTYYAKWTKMLVARMKTNTAVYTGSQIKPLFDIYEITWPDQDKPYVLGDQIATNIDPTTNPDYTITYSGESTTGVKDVGSYGFSVQLANTSALAIAGATIAQTDYEDNNKNRTLNFTVTPKLLTVKVNPDTQLQKAGATVQPADVTIDGIASTDAEANVIEKKYYKWTPADDSDTAIDPGELDLDTAPTAVAKYVLQVTVKSDNKNYKIDSVVSSKDGTPVLLYGKTATQTYPAFNILNTDGNIVPGTNIVYVIQANDPSISNVDVKSADTKDDEGIAKDPEVVNNLSLKQSDYTSDETFDNAETPTTKEYYVRVADVGAEEVRFTITLTNPDTTSLTATGGTAVKNADGTYTVTAPLTNKGATANVVKITTKAGDAADAPTITYTFNVQQLVDAKIVLNYGNSPVGMIMGDDDTYKTKDDKNAAISAFQTSRTFSGVTQDFKYNTNAWKSFATFDTDAEGNPVAYDGDLDPTAMFVFQRRNFRDVGFTAYDALGNEVDASKVTRSVTVKTMNNGVPKYNDTTDGAIDLAISTTDTDATHLFTDFIGKNVRPNVYRMTYTFTDAVTNKTVTETRKLIVVSRHGDVLINNDNTVNNADASSIVTNVGAINAANSLYRFRLADALINTDNTVNNADASNIVTKMTQLGEFYRYLPNN